MALTKVQTALTNLGVINVLDYGAVGDGVTDDTTAVQAALTAAVAASAVLHIPSGTYILSNTLTISSANPIKIVGSGSSMAILQWTSTATGGGGISLTYTDFRVPPHIEGLRLYTDAQGVGTALKITGDAASSTNLGPVVCDIELRGTVIADDCWLEGIWLVDCWYPVCERISIRGRDQSGPWTQQTGIIVDSCQAGFFSKLAIYHTEVAFEEQANGLTTRGEGFNITDFEIVGCTTGIALNVGIQAPGTNIGPGHINSKEGGISMTLQLQTSVHDILFYRTLVTLDPGTSYTGVAMDSCKDIHVHDNSFYGSDNVHTGGHTGVLLSGGATMTSCHVHDNNFLTYSTNAATAVGITLGTEADENRIHDNFGDSTVTLLINVDAAAFKNNRLHDNLPSAVQTFTASDTTPSVGNALHEMFFTANAIATSITAFDDGYGGQTIRVMANDANTTLVHGASVNLQGGGTFAMGAGAVWTGVRDFATARWRETSRRTA